MPGTRTTTTLTIPTSSTTPLHYAVMSVEDLNVGSLDAITLTNNQTGDTRRVETRNLFLCLGGVPYTEWADAVGIVRDSEGYLMTGPDLLRDGKWPAIWPLDRPPYYLETSVPGVFAAGDVRHGSVKRCASAVGEGAMAVTMVHRYLANG